MSNTIKSFSATLTFRVIIVSILAIMLLIPVSMVRQIINERENNREEAIAEIYSKWGSQQTVVGPILTVPYNTYVADDKGTQNKIVKYAHFLPNYLKIDSSLIPEKRSRGIYDAVVYSSDTSFSGTFGELDTSTFDIEPYQMDWKNAFVSVGIPDMRGIKSSIELQWGSESFAFNPGIKSDDVIRGGVSLSDLDYLEKSMFVIPTLDTQIEKGSSGISIPVPIKSSTKEIEFSFKLQLDGSDSIKFIPIGRKTDMTLRSSWKSPKFNGAFLPDERTVGNDGFTGNWEILDLNRNYPQAWTGSIYNIYDSAFGVELLSTVDQYQKSTRSVKYALLIIVLTFLVYFSAELFNQRRVHVIQYLLIGLALVLFYALLVSLSEIVGFNVGYLIACFATVGLITLYARSVLKNTRLVFIQGGILVFLYLFIYVLLQLEDFALLVGSIGLFIILAIVMYLSRKINWFEIGE